jgi:hypothetical protein
VTALRRERRLVLAQCVALLACGASPGVTSPQASHARRREREADIVVWPAPEQRADSTGGVVVLEAPRARGAAQRVVQGFFEAVRRESLRELGIWLTEDATISSGPGSTPESVAKVWAARFKRLDYGFSGAQQPYRSDELGFFSAEELLRLAPARRFELAPEKGELLAVVTTRDRRRLAGPRHFGRRIEFVLGPTPSGLRIRRMFEDFRLP